MHRTRRRDCRHAKLVAGVGAQGIFRHELLGDLPRKSLFDAALDVDFGEFIEFSRWGLAQFHALAGKIGLFGVGLGADGHILARRHRHGASHQPRDTGYQDIALLRG